MAKFEEYEYRLPAQWASAIINDDYSGCDNDEEKEIREFRKKIIEEHGSEHTLTLADMDQEPYFASYSDVNNLGGDMLDFTLLVPIKETATLPDEKYDPATTYGLYWKAQNEKKFKRVSEAKMISALMNRTSAYREQLALDHQLSPGEVQMMIANNKTVVWTDIGYTDEQLKNYPDLSTAFTAQLVAEGYQDNTLPREADIKNMITDTAVQMSEDERQAEITRLGSQQNERHLS